MKYIKQLAIILHFANSKKEINRISIVFYNIWRILWGTFYY